jgi:RNA polymerase sigma-70 factor (ECF subfamily)
VIANQLTQHQREVLVAVTIDGVVPKELAGRMRSTPDALYKALRDARRKLRAAPVAAGMGVWQLSHRLTV